MVAFLDDPAMVHDDDPVGGADGGEAVGDDDGGAVAHQPVERFLHQPLAFGVERRGGFVEQQQRRVAAEQGAGDGDALALAARQARAAFAHDRCRGLRAGRGGSFRHWRRAPPARSRPRSRPNCRSGGCRGPRRRRSPLPAGPWRCAGGRRPDRRPSGRRRRAERGPPRGRRSAGRAGRWWSCPRPTGRPPRAAPWAEPRG